MAEGARLESVFRVKPNEGSNPSLSASLYTEAPLFGAFCVYDLDTFLTAVTELCHITRKKADMTDEKQDNITPLSIQKLIKLFFSDPKRIF